MTEDSPILVLFNSWKLCSVCDNSYHSHVQSYDRIIGQICAVSSQELLVGYVQSHHSDIGRICAVSSQSYWSDMWSHHSDIGRICEVSSQRYWSDMWSHHRVIGQICAVSSQRYWSDMCSLITELLVGYVQSHHSDIGRICAVSSWYKLVQTTKSQTSYHCPHRDIGVICADH